MFETEAKGIQSEVPLVTLSHWGMGDEPQTEPAEGTAKSHIAPASVPSTDPQGCCLALFPLNLSCVHYTECSCAETARQGCDVGNTKKSYCICPATTQSSGI